MDEHAVATRARRILSSHIATLSDDALDLWNPDVIQFLDGVNIKCGVIHHLRESLIRYEPKQKNYILPLEVKHRIRRSRGAVA